MNPAMRKVSSSWRDLYQAAILDPDLNKLSERIAAAETALVVRAGELFCGRGDGAQEREGLDNAMYILRTLRRSLKRPPTVVAWRDDHDYLKTA